MVRVEGKVLVAGAADQLHFSLKEKTHIHIWAVPSEYYTLGALEHLPEKNKKEVE